MSAHLATENLGLCLFTGSGGKALPCYALPTGCFAQTPSSLSSRLSPKFLAGQPGTSLNRQDFFAVRCHLIHTSRHALLENQRSLPYPTPASRPCTIDASLAEKIWHSTVAFDDHTLSTGMYTACHLTIHSSVTGDTMCIVSSYNLDIRVADLTTEEAYNWKTPNAELLSSVNLSKLKQTKCRTD